MGSGVTITTQPMPPANPANAGVLVYNANGTPTFLNEGTANQLLAMNSGGTAVTWVNSAANPVYTLLETLSPSTSSGISTSASWSGYTSIMVVARYYGSTTLNVQMTLNGDSGADYGYSYFNNNSLSSSSGSYLLMSSTGTAQGAGFACLISINAFGSGNYHPITGTGTLANNNPTFLGGFWLNSAAATGATFTPSTGTFSGTIEIYGVL